VLVVQMPDSGDRKRKYRRVLWQGLGYLAADALIMTAAFLTGGNPWLQAAVGTVLAWLLWAIYDWRKSHHQ